jgi:urease accessory protein
MRFVRDVAGRTRLAERRQCYPLQTTGVLPLDESGAALVYVQNAAGSVFGGDRLALEVALGRGTAVCLSTPSATRFQAGALSCQTLKLVVAEDAFLESVPDPLIPHANSAHRQETALDLAEGACAILVDCLAPGRTARGEQHAYRSLSLRLTVRQGGCMILEDGLTLVPTEADPCLEGALGCGGYSGSLFAFGMTDPEAAANSIHSAIAADGAAAPLASGHGVVARFLATDAPNLRRLAMAAWNAARLQICGRPAPTLRK